ncbi:F-box/kelch-repeat protein At3g23880 [Coffea arabica]|uniref:F-box/kelch-repeat protein At3g23880 n=1 Tax=Coffea arabica TaxID=13443 RepID=A0A6P6WU59_COFAR|nr:F-box/kelch-repeat protein At3g23880-like [Coffea arabica]
MEGNEKMAIGQQIPSSSVQVSDHPLILPDLPFQVITEILARLPVKSLMRFKCVSKSWLSLTLSPHFIKRHLSFSTSKDREYLLFIDYNSGRFKHCSLASLLYEQPSDAVEIVCPQLECRDLSVLLVGCCNGMICICTNREGFVLWNPSTRKSKTLPNFSFEKTSEHKFYASCGFGYDETNDDYKVVAVTCYCAEDWEPFASEVKVYSTKADTWRRIGDFPGGYPMDGSRYCGTFAAGKVHWVLNRAFCPYVVFLDLATETYGSLDLAGDAIKSNHDSFVTDIQTVGGSLYFFCRNYVHGLVDLWVLKEYEVIESWTKVVSALSNDKRYFLSVLYQLENGKLLVVLESDVRVLNPKNNKSRRLLRSVYTRSASIYVESLVSPGSVDATTMMSGLQLRTLKASTSRTQD